MLLTLMGLEEEEIFKEIDIELYLEIKEREKKLNDIYNALQNKHLAFQNKKLEQEGLVHPDTRKQYVYQFTYFYKYGAAGHFNSNSMEDLARRILEYGLCQ